MKMLAPNDTLLMIIDIQDKLIKAAYNKEQIIKNSIIIASSANLLQIPVIVTEQYPKGLGSTIQELKSKLDKDTIICEKTSFSAVNDDTIKNAVEKQRKNQIIICGIETHICVCQTAIELVDLGYDVTLLADVSGSRNEIEHIAGINRMKEKGIHIATAEIVIFELLKSSKHPKFKEVQSLIK